MMEYILIDPKMLLYPKKEALGEYVCFFRDVIELYGRGIITVCLYKEIFDKMPKNTFHDFPIGMKAVTDSDLRFKIESVNMAFNRIIMNNYKYIDFGVCSGDQEFKVSLDNLCEDSDYFVLLSMLITSCYSNYMLSKNILVGSTNNGLKSGDEVTICCACTEKEFKNNYQWVLPKKFFDSKQEAFVILRDIVDSCENLFVKSPTIKKGDHHNKVQKESFNCFEELSSKNKRVLSNLRKIGLEEIFFGDYYPCNNEVGSIKIINVVTSTDEKTDIVKGWFYSELNFRLSITMYFPREIGKNLNLFLEGDLNQKSVQQLITDLGI